MKKRSVILLGSAKRDLQSLVEYLAREISVSVARNYIGRVQKRLSTLEYGAQRGTIRNAKTGLRVIGILPNTSVAFVVDDNEVHVLRILHGGRTLEQEDGD
ncbi:type II toxin-antitoxin system RelE/ParE family toxin [Devosia sp.]|uniref:type II toxin-antitoxin system RelE/ParE family toxin n=1 Tax=Devosia sp. TaxID=1871048 RepID=UPI0032630816